MMMMTMIMKLLQGSDPRQVTFQKTVRTPGALLDFTLKGPRSPPPKGMPLRPRTSLLLQCLQQLYEAGVLLVCLKQRGDGGLVPSVRLVHGLLQRFEILGEVLGGSGGLLQQLLCLLVLPLRHLI